MRIDTVTEKVLLSSIAASVALSGPISVEAAENFIMVDNDVSIDPNHKYSFGSKGFRVLSIQHKLQNYGLLETEVEDGIYDVRTHAAIRKFQKLKKLQVDGVAGPETLAALFINKNIEEVEVEDYILVQIQEGQLFSIGDHGDAVKEVQKSLIDTGHYHYEADGIFGTNTQRAVMDYQRDHGLSIDGVVGEETYQHLAGVSLKVKAASKTDENLSAKVFAVEDVETDDIPAPVITSSIEKNKKDDINNVDFLQNGDTGQAVKDLQRLLSNKGYYKSSLDGVFGPATEAAILNYQIQNHLRVDGIAGSNTITHLKITPSAPLPSRSANLASTNTTEVGAVNDLDLTANSIIEYAKQFIGTPYLWGGTTPNGFDCSGFIMYVYKKNGINIPRTVIDIWNYGNSVNELQVGDFVFFETYKKGPSHLGIYLGNDQFLHAGTSSGVTISDINTNYWSSKYLGAKRIN